MYGDTEQVRRRAAALRDQGADVRALADQVVARLDALSWSGRTADAFRARVLDRSTHLRAVAERHEGVAEVLTAHATATDRSREAIEARAARAAVLVDAARARREAGADPELGDEALLALVAPPAGHRDWLAVDLPGLEG